MRKLIFISVIVFTFFAACENRENEFADYYYTTVYFPYQTPIRTLVLGEDYYDNTLDLNHKCKIMATMGGVYKNNADRILDISVANDMFESLGIDGDSVNRIVPMPSEYYTLDNSMQIVIPSGSMSGGIEVQLTDAFFNDPKSVVTTYAIPLRIESVTNADSVLRGKELISNANIFIADQWTSVPKDYVLYCIKYVNPWHGAYLRRGVDEGRGNGNSALDTTIVYHEQYVERDQVVKLQTVSMTEVSLSSATRVAGNDSDIPFEIRITIDDNGACSIGAADNATYTVSGSGSFVKDADEWGNELRDAMYLQYNIDFDSVTHRFVDTLVLRDRGVRIETFTPVIF